MSFLVFMLAAFANHSQYKCVTAKECVHVMGNCQYDTVNKQSEKKWLKDHGPLVNGADCENFHAPPIQTPFCVSGVCLPGIPHGAKDKAEFYRKYSQVCSEDTDCKLVTTHNSNTIKVLFSVNPIFEKDAPAELKDAGVKFDPKLKAKCVLSKTERSRCEPK